MLRLRRKSGERKGSGERERAEYLVKPMKFGELELPPKLRVPEGFELEKSYDLESPFAPKGMVRAEIWVSKRTGEAMYVVVEPELNEHELRVYRELYDFIYFETIDVPLELPRDRFLEELAKVISERVRRYVAVRAKNVDPNKVLYYMLRDIIGFGYIDPLMRDPYIEDISCNGPNEPVFVWHREYEYIPSNIALPERLLDLLVLKLAHMGGKHISIANPIVDAILPGGHRLAATFRREVSTRGSTFVIRKFKENPITIVDMIRWRTLSPELAAYFWLMMEHRMCGVIMGVTGSGKTTTLNAIATLLKPTYKVLTIEDTPELRLPLPNWVQLVSRTFGGRGGEGGTEVTLYDLVKVALRYRPDVIIVGEIRGEEAYVLFQAMATGHGGLTTMHAESIEAAVKRLTSPPMNIPRDYIPLVNFALLIRRVEVVEGERTRIVRRVTNVWEVLDYGNYPLISEWDPATDSFRIEFGRSEMLRRIAKMRGWSESYVTGVEIPLRSAIFLWMAHRGITNFREIAKHVSMYYNPGLRRVLIERILEDAERQRLDDVLRLLDQARR